MSLEHVAFPNESTDYRAARNALLAAEMDLRRRQEQVAALRRALPPGGMVADYGFERLAANGMPETVQLAELFEGDRPLLLYSFMYGPDRDRPCPGCTHFLDSFDGVARHVGQRVTVYIVARSPLARLLAWAKDRGWPHLRFLSSAGNDYGRDYYGDSRGLTSAMRDQQDFKPGEEWDMPMLNVFTREGDTVRHRWGSEMLWVPPEAGQDYRHNDLLDPLWATFDLTPHGRGTFQPKLDYARG